MFFVPPSLIAQEVMARMSGFDCLIQEALQAVFQLCLWKVHILNPVNFSNNFNSKRLRMTNSVTSPTLRRTGLMQYHGVAYLQPVLVLSWVFRMELWNKMGQFIPAGSLGELEMGATVASSSWWLQEDERCHNKQTSLQLPFFHPSHSCNIS